MQETVNYHAIEFILELRPIEDGVLPYGIDADEQVARQDISLTVIKSDDISKVIVLQIAHIDIEDIVVRAKDDGKVSDTANLAFGYHPQPAVIKGLALETENGIFVVIRYHSRNFVQIYNY